MNQTAATSFDLSRLPVVYRTTVAETHLDRFNHVNVMWYTHFFDEATWGLFESVGCGPSYHREAGGGMFALEQHTRFLRELRLGDSVGVRARVLGLSPKRIHFLLFLATGDGVLSATSELIGMHMDVAARKSAPFPDAVRAAIESLRAAHEALPWDAPVCGVMRA